MKDERPNKHLMAALEKWKTLADREFRLAEDFAFESCGCAVAYPTWWAREDGTDERVDCSHLECMIRRGEFRRPAWAVRLNARFRAELGNWLRCAKETAAGRRGIAKLYWAMKRDRKFDMMSAVWTGILCA